MTTSHASTAPTVPPARPRLAVLFGGRSSEHGVSCLTAREVLAVIDHDRYDVRAIGLTRAGRWVEADPRDLAATGGMPEVPVDAPAVSWDLLDEIDVVFPLLHGPWGEDGTLQGLLDLAGVRYVGSGVLASAAGMDKPFTKMVLAAAGIPQVPHVTVQPHEWPAERSKVEARINALGRPVFVKPARAGSSQGVVRVDAAADLPAAIDAAAKHDPKVVVEAAAVGAREIECGVIQALDGSPVASVVGEIVVQAPSEQHDFYDFEAKYLDGTGINVVPADLPTTVVERVRTYAVQAFEALGCEGLARVDFFLRGDDLVINEVNTMPGFTASSMFPRLWEASGLSYPDLVERLITLALARSTDLR